MPGWLAGRMLDGIYYRLLDLVGQAVKLSIADVEGSQSDGPSEEGAKVATKAVTCCSSSPARAG